MEEKEYSFSFETKSDSSKNPGVLTSSTVVKTPEFLKGFDNYAEIEIPNEEPLPNFYVDETKQLEGKIDLNKPKNTATPNENGSNSILRVNAKLFKPISDRAQVQKLFCLFIFVYFIIFFLTCGLVNICFFVLLFCLMLSRICFGNRGWDRNTVELIFNTPNQVLESPDFDDIPFSQLQIVPEAGFLFGSIQILAPNVLPLRLNRFQSFTCLPLRNKDPKYYIVEEENNWEDLRDTFESISSLRGMNCAADPLVWTRIESNSESRRIMYGSRPPPVVGNRNVNAAMAARRNVYLNSHLSHMNQGMHQHHGFHH